MLGNNFFAVRFKVCMVSIVFHIPTCHACIGLYIHLNMLSNVKWKFFIIIWDPIFVTVYSATTKRDVLSLSLIFT